jgi:tetratricopeptide (TPR) repeat protein
MHARDRIAAIIVFATLVVSLMALGAALRWAACASVFLAVMAALPHLGSRRVGGLPSPLVWLFGLALVLTGVQLLPLPEAVLAWIAPERHALMLDNAAALGNPPARFSSLSYDPPATWLELAKLAGYLCFAYTCTRVAGSARGRVWLARAVAVLGVVMALIALLHHAFSLRELFGLYRPEAPTSTYLAPLLNENHLAGFLAMTVPLSIGLLLASDGLARLCWGAGAALCTGTSLLVQSRGAALALAVGLALMVVLSWWRARRMEDGMDTDKARPVDLSKAIPAGVVVACAVVLLATITAGGVRDELARTSVDELSAGDSKLGVWRAGAELAAANRYTGVGRGAFEFAFTRYHHSGLETYSHVENEYLQMLVDWGLPGTALLALIMLWVGLASLRHFRRSPVEVGALCGLAVLGLHSFVDFGLELPGVALSAIAMTAILLPEKPARAEAGVRRKRAVALVAVLAAALVIAVVASSPVARSARAEGDALAELLDSAEVPDDDVIAAGRRAFARHPSDYLLAARLAQAYYYRKRDPKALAVQNRALALNPKHAGLHVFTAKMLIAGNRPEQALIEFSLALHYTLQPGPILDQLLAWFPEPERAARGIPISRERVPVVINRLITMGRADVALAYAGLAAEELAGDAEVLVTLAELALQLDKLDLALASSERAYNQRGLPKDELIFARALMRDKQSERALEVVTRAIGHAEEYGQVDVRMYELMTRAELEVGQPERAAETARKAIDLALGDHPAQARLFELLARAESALGHAREAQRARKRAHELAAPAERRR